MAAPDRIHCLLSSFRHFDPEGVPGNNDDSDESDTHPHLALRAAIIFPAPIGRIK